MDDIKKIQNYIKSTQSDKRYIHTCGVANECEKLARLFGFSDKDIKKLCIAGWLHDITKEMPTDHQESICREFKIKMPDGGLSSPVLHARTGAFYARKIFPEFVDNDVFEAIFNHTTGRRGMSLFEMIICFSDFIEPSRKYEGCKRLRNEFCRDIECTDPLAVLLRCIRQSFDMTITSLINNGEAIDLETIDARNYVIEISASQPKEVKNES